ncbi:MAG TPA: DUF5808 domain-containing protein [bacterium]|nr:DUF5808 domain-containing protein [bacterium]HPN44994.1 DUF5808 domain-containing protein [bacterium]
MLDNDENYKWGIFYYNLQDRRLFVPKRNKLLGWTLNFANPWAYMIIVGIIAFAILMEKLGNAGK